MQMGKVEGDLRRQLDFLTEIDKVKSIVRRTYLLDGSRNENDAEHSWHLALMAMVLAPVAAEEKLDTMRVLEMVLVHDLVEIDAGDTFIYADYDPAEKERREKEAAERIFGLLPPEQARRLRTLWDEFEAASTPEARFATALDRFQPFLHNYVTRGIAWKEHGVTEAQVRAIMAPVAARAPRLGGVVEALLDDAVAQGFLS